MPVPGGISCEPEPRLYTVVASVGKLAPAARRFSLYHVCTEKPPRRSTRPGPRARRHVTVFSLVRLRPVPENIQPAPATPPAMIERGAKLWIPSNWKFPPNVVRTRRVGVRSSSPNALPSRRDVVLRSVSSVALAIGLGTCSVVGEVLIHAPAASWGA